MARPEIAFGVAPVARCGFPGPRLVVTSRAGAAHAWPESAAGSDDAFELLRRPGHVPVALLEDPLHMLPTDTSDAERRVGHRRRRNRRPSSAFAGSPAWIGLGR